MTTPAAAGRDRWPDPAGIRVLLCDADGNLFPSEEPAFVASAKVTNAFLASLGVAGELSAQELRLGTTGKNFRTTAVDLCVANGVPLDPRLAAGRPDAVPTGAPGAPGATVLTPQALAYWVAEEKRAVSAYLGQVLAPDPEVLEPVGKLAAQFALAAVSSSAASRLDVCFTATGLAPLFPAGVRYSAEDSLPTPRSKPDPAVYRFAGHSLGCAADEALAIEDSLPGAQSAIAAGFATIGNVMFVPGAERAQRVEVLRSAGVAGIVTSWRELAGLLCSTAGRP